MWSWCLIPSQLHQPFLYISMLRQFKNFLSKQHIILIFPFINMILSDKIVMFRNQHKNTRCWRKIFEKIFRFETITLCKFACTVTLYTHKIQWVIKNNTFFEPLSSCSISQRAYIIHAEDTMKTCNWFAIIQIKTYKSLTTEMRLLTTLIPVVIVQLNSIVNIYADIQFFKILHFVVFFVFRMSELK